MHEKCKDILYFILVKFYTSTFMYNICDYK